MVHFVADYVIADIRQRAKCWRDDEIRELAGQNHRRAAECRIRAIVLEQLADDLSAQKAVVAA